MKSIACWEDLRPFGIIPLTGEACGLMMRILCDVTPAGKTALEKCFDCQLTLPEPWNHRERQIGSVMLSPEMMVPVGIFALLESGCREVFRKGDVLYGVELTDTAEALNEFGRFHGPMRRYAYQGTAGSRNVHQMTGRIT